MTWPTHPDGSNKTMGEMTAEERGVQATASVARFRKLRIVADYDPKPIPVRDFDWSAIDDATYDGEGSKIGNGATEAEAIADLLEKLEIYCRDVGAFVDPTMGACIECGAEQGVACRSAEFAALARPSHTLADIAAANPYAPWSRQLRMQGE